MAIRVRVRILPSGKQDFSPKVWISLASLSLSVLCEGWIVVENYLKITAGPLMASAECSYGRLEHWLPVTTSL